MTIYYDDLVQAGEYSQAADYGQNAGGFSDDLLIAELAVTDVMVDKILQEGGGEIQQEGGGALLGEGAAAPTLVDCALGIISLDGLACSITVGSGASAGEILQEGGGAILAEGGADALAAEGSPSSGTTVNCTLGTLALAGLQATITASGATIVTCSLGQLTIAGMHAAISIGGDAALIAACAITFEGSDSTIPVFDVGDLVRVLALFSDAETGVELDPDFVEMSLREPDATITQPSVIRDSEGAYHANIDAELPGKYRFRVIATGFGQCAQEGQFTVQPTMVQ